MTGERERRGGRPAPQEGDQPMTDITDVIATLETEVREQEAAGQDFNAQVARALISQVRDGTVYARPDDARGGYVFGLTDKGQAYAESLQAASL